MIVSHEITKACTRTTADAIVAALREAGGSHYLQPRFAVAPCRGEFLVLAESDHEDAAAELVPALLACLAYRLGMASFGEAS